MIPYQKQFVIAAFLLGLTAAAPAAENTFTHDGLFANPNEVFAPLIADPRELHTTLRLTMPVSNTAFGDVAVGNYFGLYRWTLPWENSYLQWSIGGGVFARFDLVSEQKDNEVIDYAAQMPLDMRIGKWSMRFMPFHISSHLGDDFIKRTGIVPQKYALDGIKGFVAYDTPWSIRVYGGFPVIIRHTEAAQDRFAIQSGAEWNSKWWANGHAQTFIASDFQFWERVGWNPQTTIMAGIRFAHDPEDKHTLSVFTEYSDGQIVYGQFVQDHETHWGLGLRLDFL